jgi:DNA ligase (NAD+)
MFSENQQQILKQANLSLQLLTESRLFELINYPGLAVQLSDTELEEFLAIANAMYRGGEEIVSDADYDFVFMAELAKRNPDHPFLSRVEPEPAFYGKTVELPVRMLSTDKAYTQAEIERWAERIKKVALDLGKDYDSLIFKVTPKLDGYAAYDDGQKLYTRGDGTKGTDISRVFERGLQVANQGQRGLGAGEVVISKSYFSKHLAAHFDNSRNFQASIIKEKELSPHAEQAINDNAAVFYPFALLPCWTGTAQTLFADFDGIIKKIWHQLDYDVDGVVLEITDEDIKSYMGATRHHHRWQIAYKENLNSAEVTVLSVTPQTSRSGRITPVAELEPTRLSGALIQRATAHYYGMVKEWGIAKDAVIKLTRSGEVIPKIERVLVSKYAEIPEYCPSCNSELVWDANDLYCLNSENCPAQIESSIEHFFKILGNVDGFGVKNIEKLNANGISSVYDVYLLNLERLMAMGFGEKTSQNLLDELERSRKEAIEDWRFLGAFGMDRMGLGNCERLLQKYPLDSIFILTQEDIEKIKGFDKKTAKLVIEKLKGLKIIFEKTLALGFNLVSTKENISNNDSPIFDKLLVFTGTMKTAKRDELIKEAKQLGAKIGTAVTNKTDYLITGDNVGATKINDANKKGVKVITEDEYFSLLSNQG